ncbi:MAG: hypothetical protein PHE77_02840, partial [Candidatus Pacebacteria bacterium]|nr:hypothetical protein [Candidatus Paceibacterota bacterium]
MNPEKEIKKWLKEQLLSEDDKPWKAWVDFERREPRDLANLLQMDVKESIKKRAILLLLLPNVDWLPLYWTERENVGKFYQDETFLEKLSPTLLNYAAELIIRFCEVIKPLHCDKPKSVVEGGRGIKVFMQIPDKYHDALYFYNHCILDMLSLLPEAVGERLFALYSLKDISTYYNMEEASGYNPFQILMLRQDLDERWKRKADEAMKKIIFSEVRGETKPRENWEDASTWYGETLGYAIGREKLPYSPEFLIDQIGFLISKDLDGSRVSVSSYKVIEFLQLLGGDEHKKLRQDFSRFVLSKNHDKF